MSGRLDGWMCDRYRTVLQELDPGGLPPTDVLYIDLDDVVAAYVDWSESSLKRSEAGLFAAVSKRIQFLVETIQPRRELVVSLSGVLPAAFVHRERARKVQNRRTLTSPELHAAVNADGTFDLFNCNALTPGTELMRRLDAHLKFLIRYNMAFSLYWKKLRVLYSGSDLEGDASSKIFEVMRSIRCDRLATETLTHGVYSTKHDTPLHALATREPYVYIVTDKHHLKPLHKIQRTDNHDEFETTDFVLLYMNLFRECWEQEFRELCPNLDAHRTLDDFLLICSLLGNRALPRMPTLHIQEGALDDMLTCYKEFLAPSLAPPPEDPFTAVHEPSASPHLTSADRGVNLLNLEAFLGLIGREHRELARLRFREKLQAARQIPSRCQLMSDEAVGLIYYDDQPYEWWKEWYYTVKLKLARGDREARRTVVKEYLTALIWYFEYLVGGARCWGTAYDKPYAPALSDLVSVADDEIQFSGAEPMCQLEYMLCVLPAGDAAFLPKSHQCIMTDAASAFASLYADTRGSLEYGIDIEGAWFESEKIPVIGSFDVGRIQKTIGHHWEIQKEIWPKLKRLENGYQCIFLPNEYSREALYCESTLEAFYPSVTLPSGSTMIYARPVRTQRPPTDPGLGAEAEPPDSFPRLATPLKLKSVMTFMKFDRHGKPTDRESLVLEGLTEMNHWPGTAKKIFDALKDRTVIVGYPCSIRATVVGVSDHWNSVFLPGRNQRRSLGGSTSFEFQSIANETKGQLWLEQGINIGKCGVVLHVIVQGDLRERIVHYPLQLTVIPLEEGDQSAEHCLFQTDLFSSASAAQPIQRDESVCTGVERSSFGPVPADVMLSTNANEGAAGASVVASSYSTYMDQQQIYDDETLRDGALESTAQSAPPEALSGDQLDVTADGTATKDALRSEKEVDDAIQAAYEAEIQKELEAFGEAEGQEPWTGELSDVLPSEIPPAQTGLEREESEPEAEIGTPSVGADDGLFSATDVAQEMEISEAMLQSVLTECRLCTSTGPIPSAASSTTLPVDETVDAGLGLEVYELASVRMGQELKEILEVYMALHFWVFCLLESTEPLPDGRLAVSNVLLNPKLEQKSIRELRSFLQSIPPAALHSLQTPPEPCCCSLSKREQPSPSQIQTPDVVSKERMPERVKYTVQHASYDAECIGQVKAATETQYCVQFLPGTRTVWLDKSAVTELPPIDTASRGFSLHRTMPPRPEAQELWDQAMEQVELDETEQIFEPKVMAQSGARPLPDRGSYCQ